MEFFKSILEQKENSKESQICRQETTLNPSEGCEYPPTAKEGTNEPRENLKILCLFPSVPSFLTSNQRSHIVMPNSCQCSAEKKNDVKLSFFPLTKPLSSGYHDRDYLRGLHNTLQAPKANFNKSKLKIEVHFCVHIFPHT